MKKLLILLMVCFATLSIAYGDIVVGSNTNQHIANGCGQRISLGNYTTATTYQVVICPDNSDHGVSITLTGRNFPAGASLSIFDGNGPDGFLLAYYDETTTSYQLGAQATRANTSGCLTLKFTSSVAGASFTGNITCPPKCNNYEVHITNTSPQAIVTEGQARYVNLCWNSANNQSEDITFTARTVLQENQSPVPDANVIYKWNFQDGSGEQVVQHNNTITHHFPARQGYTVLLNSATTRPSIDNDVGCSNTNAEELRVRVSRSPIWDAAHSTCSPSQICLGEQANVCCRFSSSTWESSITPQVAGRVDLPDCPSGITECYESPLVLNQFKPGDVLTDVNGLLNICLNICHTFLGDLTMFVQCPNGTSVQLELQAGGGCDLGVPPNTGAEFCFSPTATQTLHVAGTNRSSLPNGGTFASDYPLTALVGCPLNGQWTIRVCDQWHQDCGTLFGWHIDFDDDLFPQPWSYTPTYTYQPWGGNAGVSVTPPDNGECVQGTYYSTTTPTVNSQQPFICTVKDEFGCEHDTSIFVTVRHALDPECCIPPTPTLQPLQICGRQIPISVSLSAPANTGEWSLVSGPGQATFGDSHSPSTTVTVTQFGEYTFRWDEYHNGDLSCTGFAEGTINFKETKKPDLASIAPVCVGTEPISINLDPSSQLANFGALSCNPDGPWFNADAHTFDPSKAGTYHITNVVRNPCSGIDEESTKEIIVRDNVNVENLIAECVDGLNPHISWEVHNSNGDRCNEYYMQDLLSTPVTTQHRTGNTAYLGSSTGTSPYRYHFQIFDSPTPDNSCSVRTIQGVKNCDCSNYAGTMSTEAVFICHNPAEGNGSVAGLGITHSGEIPDHTYEATQGLVPIFRYMLHKGDYVPIAWSENIDFGFTGFTNLPSPQPNSYTLQYGVTYYISAVMSFQDANTPPLPDISATAICYSMSEGTPVVWYKQPVANAGADRDTCGNIITLHATVEEGVFGQWSANREFTTFDSTNVRSPRARVISDAGPGETMFTWSVSSGRCSAADSVKMTFKGVPTPFAGNDTTVCGNVCELQSAQGSMEEADYNWSGASVDFTPENELQTTATNSGTDGKARQVTLTEIKDGCQGSDNLLITYIPEPNPTVAPGVDTICGKHAVVNTVTVPAAVGSWVAYESNDGGNTFTVPMSPQPIMLPNNTSPTINVTVEVGNEELVKPVEFEWTEIQAAHTGECSNSVRKRLVFARVPSAHVTNDNSNICGTCVTLEANVSGSAGHSWAVGSWGVLETDGSFTGETANPTVEYCIPITSFDETGKAVRHFIWTMKNPQAPACYSNDKYTATFYERPRPQAGPDIACCGSDTTLTALFGIPEQEGIYTPVGRWRVDSCPVGGLATLSTLIGDNQRVPYETGQTVNVSVSPYGIYQFIFTETNTSLSTCKGSDSVKVQFIEIPHVFAGSDKPVCGPETVLEAVSSSPNGVWEDNEASIENPHDPHSATHYDGTGQLEYVWRESNSTTLGSVTKTCYSYDTVVIHFYTQPNVSIAADMPSHDSVCGLRYDVAHGGSELVANEISSSDVNGLWYCRSPRIVFDNPTNNITGVEVDRYGYYDFYWIGQSGPENDQSFRQTCTDTAGPIRIHFIKIPNAQITKDCFTICGDVGTVSAEPSVGVGRWQAPNAHNIYFGDDNNPLDDTLSTMQIHGVVPNEGSQPQSFTITWQKDNLGCGDVDTAKVFFARYPASGIDITPPKCFGEPAIILAKTADTAIVSVFDWNLGSDFYIDSTIYNQHGGEKGHWVHWDSDETLHKISLKTFYFPNSVEYPDWKCPSDLTKDTVYEPPVPEYIFKTGGDTCSLGLGGLIAERYTHYVGQRNDTVDLSYHWFNDTIGHPNENNTEDSGDKFWVDSLPAGTYYVEVQYQTPNIRFRETYNRELVHLESNLRTQCFDTLSFSIDTVGMINAAYSIAADIDIEELTAPSAVVRFVNTTNSGDVKTNCKWYWDDKTKPGKLTDEIVEHIYTKPGEYCPYLVVWNKQQPQCVDTSAAICFTVDDASKLEIPNIFSPNGDGINDYFQVTAKTLRTFEGKIVNRWGRTVFEWTDWTTEDAGWDGKLSGGNLASPGVYYYIINAEGNDNVKYENLSGPLHLMRE